MNVSESPDKRFIESKPDTFIFEIKNALTAEQCEQMIERFEASEDMHQAGRIGQQIARLQRRNLVPGTRSGRTSTSNCLPPWPKSCGIFVNNFISFRGHSRILAIISSVICPVSIITGILTVAVMNSVRDNWLPYGI